MPSSVKVKKRKIDYQGALKDVAKSMVRLKKPDRLLKLITRFIDRQFGLTHTSLLVLQPDRERYVFVDSKGSRRFPIGLVKFDLSHPLVGWFQNPKKRLPEQKDFLLRTDVEKILSPKNHNSLPEDKKKQLAQARKSMESLKAELVVPGYFKDSLLGILILGKKISKQSFTQSELAFFQTIAHDCSMAVKTAEYHQNLVEQNERLAKQLLEIEAMRAKEQKTYYEIMRSLARQVHAKDSHTSGHIEEVEKLGLITAEELGLDLSGRRKSILSAGLILHDVGKIGVPDHILKKPGRLNPEEWIIMQTHVEQGAKILEPLTDFKEVKEIVLSHHEKFDGTGYPGRLKGEKIPIEARIVSVVDAFHAIISTRCYSRAKSLEGAFQELRRCSGSQFDPRVVEAFISVFKKKLAK